VIHFTSIRHIRGKSGVDHVLIVPLSRLTFAYRSTFLIAIEGARASSDLPQTKRKTMSEPLRRTGNIRKPGLSEKGEEEEIYRTVGSMLIVSDDVGNKIADPEQELNKAVGAQRTCVRGNRCIVSCM
jgi:hypothetical protein